MDRLWKCINNNHALYHAVFLPKGISFEQNDSIWYSLEKPPPLYSSIVTRSPEWQPDGIFREIDNRFESEGWNEWTIKDSFGVLELEAYGFSKLFDAEWLYLDARNFVPIESRAEVKYRLVDNPEQFEAWLKAWNPDPDLGRRIFKFELGWELSFVAGYIGDSIVSGFISNHSDGVEGISNFFTPKPADHYWSELLRNMLTEFAFDVVGYFREPAPLIELGFESQGPLTVWIKRK